MFRSVLKMSSVSSAPKPAAGSPDRIVKRVDEALVEDAEHDVDHDDRHQQHEAQALHRRLEGLRGALEAGQDGGRQRIEGGGFHGGHGVAERDTRAAG